MTKLACELPDSLVREPHARDPIAMAVALRPEIGTRRRTSAATIVTGDGPTRGMVMFDELSREPKGAKISVVEEASREEFIKMLHDALRGRFPRRRAHG